MKTEEKNSRAVNELQFELKYCERCGGLWLRPVGGGQIYCVACGREMAELPPASHEPESARMPQGPRWKMDHCDYEDRDGGEGVDLDAAAEGGA
jgi:Zn-finger nucleic acid-binding protein